MLNKCVGMQRKTARKKMLSPCLIKQYMMLNKNDIEHQFQNQLLILSIIKISTFKEKKSPQETPANFPTSP